MSRVNNSFNFLKTFNAGLYLRLSKEDGDKIESDSITNQKKILEDHIKKINDLVVIDTYIDDGFTGTNFDRPGFNRLLEDIEKKIINCVIVKDLSRLGRDYLDAGHYLERYFPLHQVRFISINDGIDSNKASYDLMIPIKNLFNEQYVKDISKKVQSALYSKQMNGDFIGAFTSYGYIKDPNNHNRLIVDEYAANVVQSIFKLFIEGTGKVSIAKILNKRGVKCPSEYKFLSGQNYKNGNRIGETTYWTYSTVDRILKNQMYIGNMSQGHSFRPSLHEKSKILSRENWIVIENTHEPIINHEVWDKAQFLLKLRTRHIDFNQNIGIFAGYAKCGDCGRAMHKTNSSNHDYLMCGSYKKYGSSICSKHSIRIDTLEQIILNDLNSVIQLLGNIKTIIEKSKHKIQAKAQTNRNLIYKFKYELEVLFQQKKGCYFDYKDNLISLDDYLFYKKEFEQKEELLNQKIEALSKINELKQIDIVESEWVKSLLQKGKIDKLDRLIIIETIDNIKIYENSKIEIIYKFSDEYGFIQNTNN